MIACAVSCRPSCANFGAADGFAVLREREPEINDLRHEEITLLVSLAGERAEHLVRAVKRREVGGDRRAVGRDVGRPHHGAGGIDGVDSEGFLLEIDVRMENAEGFTEQDEMPSISRPSLVGNIIAMRVRGPSQIADLLVTLAGRNL